MAILLLSGPVSAQMFSYGGYEGRATQALSITTYLIDFQYDGDIEGPVPRLDWDGSAYGVAFTRRNIAASIVFGNVKTDANPDVDDLQLVDATLSAWGEIIRSRGSDVSIGLPIVLHSGYRSVDGDFQNVNDTFSYTVLGLGTGVTFDAEPARTVNIQARAWPAIAMAFRSFEGFAGSSTLVDSDLQIHFMNLFGRYGLSLGYGYRWQKWNTDDVVLVTNVSRDVFDYKSNQHMIRLGLNW